MFTAEDGGFGMSEDSNFETSEGEEEEVEGSPQFKCVHDYKGLNIFQEDLEIIEKERCECEKQNEKQYDDWELMKRRMV